MKELKDYLHLYLGCKVLYNNEEYYLEGFQRHGIEYGGKWIFIMIDADDCHWVGIDEIKPILSPLSDMTEMEIIKLMTIVHKSIFGSAALISETKLVIDENEKDKIGFICKDEFGERIGFSIEVDRGIEFSYNEIKLKVNQFEYTKWLLKNNFDIFGLIESGLAVEKTKEK